MRLPICLASLNLNSPYLNKAAKNRYRRQRYIDNQQCTIHNICSIVSSSGWHEVRTRWRRTFLNIHAKKTVYILCNHDET